MPYSPEESALFSRLGSYHRTAQVDGEDGVAAEMRRNRRINQRQAATSTPANSSGGMGSGVSDVSFATGRTRDPLFYWKQNNLPYDYSREDELKKIRAYTRLLYITDPIIGSCIDIYSKWPLVGMELSCFAGETEVITRDGTTTIGELSGRTVPLLTTGGRWVDAPVRSFGRQKLLALTVQRNRRTKTIYTTRDHRWFVDREEGPGRGNRGETNTHAKLTWEQVEEIREIYARGGVTQAALGKRFGISQVMVGGIVRGTAWKTSGRERVLTSRKSRTTEVRTHELRPGDRLTSAWVRSAIRDTNPSPFGIAHGVTWGDGAFATSGGGAFVDLFGAKDAALLRFFQGCTVYDFGPRDGFNVASVRVSNLPAFFKRLPDRNESTSYLYGFLAGWFAADGTVSQDGTEAYLDSADKEALRFARDLCHRLGIKTYGQYTISGPCRLPQGTVIDRTAYRLPIDVDSLTEAFFVTDEHRRRWSARAERTRRETWTVVSIEETDRIEEVYCAVVPDTHAFVLEDNILTGNCKDEKLKEFYEDHFFGEDGLNYNEFLLDVGREYWTTGEAWPFATFNETLGIWDDEELLNPDNVEVQRSPFLKEPRYFIELPETLRDVLRRREPRWEYEKLVQAYPELIAYTNENTKMPVSNVLLRQLKFKGDTFNPRGIPLLTRAMRSVIQQEMLNAALDAIADRLYTPLILVKLGASATDLGTQHAWVPTEDERADFEEALDSALAADFRALIHHFAVDIEPVFGREAMPDLTPDFERIEDRILQSFGLSRTLLTGADAGETYAADALNRDLVAQLLSTYQELIKKHFRQRALVVAEAQEHYDYDERNGKRYVKMEEILEIDEETGEERIVEQPKLLIPELQMRSLNLSDRDQERQFVEMLRGSGVPISMKRRLVGTDIDFDDERERVKEEAVQLAVDEQEVRRETYMALRDDKLPIPDDLRRDFEPQATVPGQEDALPEQDPARLPMLGLDPTVTTPNLAPTQDDLAQEPGDEPTAGQDPGTELGGQVVQMPAQMLQPMVQPQVPEESNEQREGMPKPAQLWRQSARTREIARAQEAPELERDDEGNPIPSSEPAGRFAAPRHLGARRVVEIDPDQPLEAEQG